MTEREPKQKRILSYLNMKMEIHLNLMELLDIVTRKIDSEIK